MGLNLVGLCSGIERPGHHIARISPPPALLTVSWLLTPPPLSYWPVVYRGDRLHRPLVSGSYMLGEVSFLTLQQCRGCVGVLVHTSRPELLGILDRLTLRGCGGHV